MAANLNKAVLDLIDGMPPEGIENLDVARKHMLDVRVENMALLRSLTLKRNNVVYSQLESGQPTLMLASEEAKVYKDATSNRNDAKKAWGEVSRLNGVINTKARENRELSIKISNLNHSMASMKEDVDEKVTMIQELQRQLNQPQEQSEEIKRLMGEQEISKYMF